MPLLETRSVLIRSEKSLKRIEEAQDGEGVAGANAKHHPVLKHVVLVACFALLAGALLFNLLWTWSSSSSSFLPSDNKSVKRVVTVEKKEKKLPSHLQNLEFNATYADIPAPTLEWEEMAEAPVPRLDGSAVQINDLLYVISGYGTIDHVHSHVDIYNFTSNTWVERIDTPKLMANSHLGVATDGRYIYIISGQYGPQCRGPTSNSFVLDAETKQWDEFPPLPVPRYAPATQIWRGRLHVMGGSKENRHTPATEHWSIAVKDGKAVEKEWRSEVAIPRGGPHRACIIVDDRLVVIGGQEEIFRRNQGHLFSNVLEDMRFGPCVVYGDVYVTEDGKKWTQWPPMPKPDSHIEFAWIMLNNSILIVGGTTEKHPVTKRMILVGEIFRLRLDTLEWSVIGRMPFRDKTVLAGYWNGWLYFTSGQRDRGPDDPSPKRVIGSTWRTKLKL